MTERNGVAVITGAASGIGRGLATEAHARGMRVVLADIDEAGLREAASAIRGETLIVPTDVSDAASVEKLAERAFAEFGRVDLLFNNAGVLSGGLSWEITPERWARVFDINVMGVVHGVASFVPRMIAAGHPSRIVNTASIGGFLSSPFIAPYTASKFAVVALTEALAVELSLQGAPIAVSVLAPGAVRSEIYAETRSVAGDDPVARSITGMRNFTENTGLDPAEFARWVFTEIDAGKFWLIMQPEIWGDAILSRTQRALAGVNPTPGDYGVEQEP